MVWRSSLIVNTALNTFFAAPLLSSETWSSTNVLTRLSFFAKSMLPVMIGASADDVRCKWPANHDCRPDRGRRHDHHWLTGIDRHPKA
jgi:hypothetical protein